MAELRNSENSLQLKAPHFVILGQFWINSATMVACFAHNSSDKVFGALSHPSDWLLLQSTSGLSITVLQRDVRQQQTDVDDGNH